MARISSGANSKQNYGTPWEFLTPTAKLFGPIVFDLAAEEKNKKHHRYFAKALKGKCKSKICQAVAHDSFAQDWAALTKKYGGILWLNPPFKKILRWVLKCLEESRRGANVVMLSSAAVGSDWYLKKVFGVADTIILNGRLTFDDEPFMRDLMLTHWWPGMTGKMSIWDWRKNLMHELPSSKLVLPQDPEETFRIYVERQMPDGALHSISEGGFQTVDAAREYVSDVSSDPEVKVLKSQIVSVNLIEEVVQEAA